MSLPPADRTATRRAATIDPNAERRRIAELLATLPPDAPFTAAELAAEWPRLIHKLARRGELTAPSFNLSR
jgi:hypothetical protein